MRRHWSQTLFIMTAQTTTTMQALALVSLLSSILSASADTCTFEEGFCKGWVTLNCSRHACFSVRKVASMQHGPVKDHTLRSEQGSCAYATADGTIGGPTIISRMYTGPLCFTAWYHQSGTAHHAAEFSAKGPDSLSRIFYVTRKEMAGRWQRVTYSDKRKGPVVIRVYYFVRDSFEESTFALDDLTLESGECPKEPVSGSCNFDLNDTCGYDLGKGNNAWQLSNGQEKRFLLADYSTGTNEGGVLYLGLVKNYTSAVATSPKLPGRPGAQCLRFQYYLPWTQVVPKKAYTITATIVGKEGTRENVWYQPASALYRGTWAAVDVAFREEKDFQIELRCTLQWELFIGRPYCAIDAISLKDCAGKREKEKLRKCKGKERKAAQQHLDGVPASFV